MTLHSEAHPLGPAPIPTFQSLGVMMMPFDWSDPLGTLATEQIGGWRETVADLCQRIPARGIGYVTIDERVIPAGETHRRPGAHVDGHGVWGGSPSPYATGGMILLSSTLGAEFWTGDIPGEAGPEGDCEHLSLGPGERMAAGVAYWCAPMCVHRSVPVTQPTRRQLLRLSLPSDEPHHWPYTPNVTGVLPTTPPGPNRSHFMAYREGRQ